MKAMKLFTILSLSAVIFAGTAFANPMMEKDTLKVIVDGELKAAVNLENLDELEELDINLDSIMMEVEKALEEIDENLQDIEIIEKEDEKVIIIKDKDGEVVETVELESYSDDDDEFEVKFEKSREDKNLHPYMVYEIGSNNYLENQKFPSGDVPYLVKPFGSWSFSLGGGMRAYATSWLSFDFGADLLWYNFKMEDKAIDITESENPSEIMFTSNDFYNLGENDAIRSKLRVSYVNANLMPVFHIGKKTGGFNRRTFRIGVGGYAGYRIGSMTKNVYDEDGQKRKLKNHDNFYLNSFRYGAKAMIGIKEVNIFLNYDLNTLFEEGKGPDGKNQNAFSFGLNFTI